MRALTLRSMAVFVAVGALAAPARAQDAREADLERVRGDLAALAAELDELEPGDAKVDDFTRRAGALDEDLVYLKVKMRRHRDAEEPGTGVPRSELARVERAVAELRADVAAAFGADAASLRVPAGTALQVRLDDAISSRSARVEDLVSASVVRAVRAEGRIAIPEGTSLRGLVRDAQPAERPSKAGRLDLEFDALYLGGEKLEMRARVAEFEEGGGAGKKAGIGAAVGGIVGGLLGGKEGAIVGIIVGGGGAVVGTKGEDVELPAGTVLTIRLDRPLVVPEPSME